MDEQKLVPKLRFPGFTDPWEQCKLGEIVNIERGGSPRPIDNYITADADGLNWIKIGDAPEQGRYIVHAAEKIKPSGLSKTRQVEPGDLILSNSMSFGKPYIMGIPGCIHDGWLLIRNNQNIFDLKFLCNLLGTDQIHAQYRRLAAGSAVNNLNKELVSGTNVGVPSKAEQLKIGQFFESMDEYITLHQRKLEHLKLKKKSLLQKLFPKEGELYPELRFPGFTDPWEQRKLGEIATFSKGIGYSKSDLNAVGSPIILYGRLYTKYEVVIDNVDTYVIAKPNSVISRKGDVLVPASGETSEEISIASAVEKAGILLGGDLNIIHKSESLDSVFLALSISHGAIHKELIKRAQGKSVVHLHNKDLQQAQMKYPSICEQLQISSCFRIFDNLITLHQRKLEHLQLLKKALLQQLFV